LHFFSSRNYAPSAVRNEYSVKSVFANAALSMDAGTSQVTHPSPLFMGDGDGVK